MKAKTYADISREMSINRDDDIFNMKKLNDIPPELMAQLSIAKRKDLFADRIIELFRFKNTLSIDEVSVGYFRKFGSYKNRKCFMSKLYNMSRSDKWPITPVKGRQGVYKYDK